MAASKNHDYHLVDPDPWPLIGAICGGALFSDAVMWFHINPYGVPLMSAAFVGELITMNSWWSNTIREAHTGYHTPVVQLHLRYGMIMFIASEVMFFLAWFWAFFDSAIFPIVCLIRSNRGDFMPKLHFGLEAAAWYWHFVDVVWLCLFTSIYVWGGW